MIDVTDKDISFAEGILLPHGYQFDSKERIPFIKNFRSLDVQAVPGSGKTTALLAKLLIIERKLPLPDGSGILVLSHTNTAVDNIRNTIAIHCPRLFRYPNFIGTIQSFVDTFIAIPYYRNCFKTSPVIIDGAAYSSRLERSFEVEVQKQFSGNKALFKKLWGLKKNSDPFREMRFGLEAGEPILLAELNGKKLEFTKPIKFTNQPEYTDAEKQEIYQWAFNLKQKVLVDGFLHFDDCYFLAKRAVTKFPSIREDLHHRFPDVFVDEMQDMSSTQVSLLNDLFESNDDDSKRCFQRIGDVNQSIHGENTLSDYCNWEHSNRTVVPISGTYRFNQVIASIVQKFALTPNEIFSNAAETVGTPQLLLYNADRIKEVLPLFASIASEQQQRYPNHYDGRYPVKAIGWRKEHETGRALKDYFSDYTPIDSVARQTGPSLWVELVTAKRTASEGAALGPINKAIWKALLLCLKLEGSSDFRNSRDVQQALFKLHKDSYDSLTSKIHAWCVDAMEGDLKEVHKDIKSHIESDFLKLFGLSSEKSKAYAETITDVPIATFNENHNVYICGDTGLKVEVCTVHSAKGETHAATLYLETYYQSDGGKSYESQRLMAQLKGEQINTTKKRTKESAKMVYVGFSRPKYLLCFAANKDHFSNEDLTEIEKQGWQIRKDLCD